MRAKQIREMRIRIYEADLPDGAEGLSFSRGGDSYGIVLSERLTGDELTQAVIHELLHIWHDDNNKRGDVSQIEQERHREAERLFPYICTG